jgi:heavy metal sensor kinase
MTNLSIRLRLTAWYSVVLLLGLALFGFGVWFALHARLVAGLDTRLAQHAQGLRRELAEGRAPDRARMQRELAEFASDVPDGTLIELRDASGGILVPSPSQRPLPAYLTSDRTTRRTLQLGGTPYRVVLDRLQPGGQTYDVLVAGSMQEVEDVMRDFRNLLFLMIPAVMAVACLGGYWLSLRALRPVDEITSVAKSISVQNLSQRLAVPRTGDELQRMAQTWNEVLERLDSAVDRIRQFTADASHELRTPLALIRTTAELALRREREPEEYRRSLRAIENEAERMTALTESLLIMARADSNGFNMVLAPTDMNQMVSHVVNQSQALAIEKGILLKAEHNGRPAMANADAPGIQRVLLILIDNALKHTPNGGLVTVSAQRSDSSVVLSVSDTGEGIAADALPHIFERFYRSDPARGGGSGFGLGLSIAQAIAQAHGARITVESSPGAGARFAVALKV